MKLNSNTDITELKVLFTRFSYGISFLTSACGTPGCLSEEIVTDRSETYDTIFESLLAANYLEESEIEMPNNFMSANTPPYDGSEHEDEQLLNTLLSDSALNLPEDNCLCTINSRPERMSRNSSFSGSCSPSSIYEPETEFSLSEVAESSMINENASVSTKSKKTVRGKSVSQNRGAINARENREKRKLYIKGLEDSVSQLTKENESMKSQIDLLQKTVDALSQDAAYLRNVMENQSELSKILQAVSTVPGITVKPSLKTVNSSETANVSKKNGKRAIPASDDVPNKKVKTQGGICLHVRNGSVSFELCSQCNASSST